MGYSGVSGRLNPCCHCRMLMKSLVRAWFSGWRDLFFYDSIPGYRARRWLERKRLDCTAFWHLFGCAWFRRGVLLLVIVQLLVLSLAWHWDLAGWCRDLLRMAPGLFVLPCFATARRVAIERILQNPKCSIRERAHRQQRR